MNTSNVRSTLLALAALVLPHTANAMLLVGWYDFESSTANESSEPGSTALGFSGTLFKNSDSIGDTGDNGGGAGIFYGDSNLPSGPGNDGLVRVPTPNETIGGVDGAIFSMTNSSGSAVSLANLFFDATQSSATTVTTLAYRIGAGTFNTLITYPVNTFNNTGTNFSDKSFSLIGIPALLNNETIQFKFTVGGSGQGLRLDNIAITAIPEPASLIGLGLVLGSGLLLRQRPRQFSAGLA
jgi:hypothetical protein